MFGQPADKILDLELWFGDVRVAELFDITPHQGTWFARYQQVVDPAEGALPARLDAFIRFCEEWHARLERDEDAEASEFDQFPELITTSAWRVPCPDGRELPMDGGPVFVEGEVSWNHPEVEPSREEAAHQLWLRLVSDAPPDEIPSE